MTGGRLGAGRGGDSHHEPFAGNANSPRPNHRASVNAECVTAYNDLKLNKKYKYVIFKLSDDNKEIVVDSTSEDGPEYDDFREKLINAKTKSKTVRLDRSYGLAICSAIPFLFFRGSAQQRG